MAHASHWERDEGFRIFKQDIMMAASELFYPPSAISLIESSESRDEITRIMSDCRNGTFSSRIYRENRMKNKKKKK